MTLTLPYHYEHPHPAVATDIAVFGLREGRLQLLLIRRGAEPFADRWALPGGFLGPRETIEACARRELLEETGVEGAVLRLVGVFSEPDRDPRERVVSVAYAALVHLPAVVPRGGTDAAEARWWPQDDLPALAFDHGRIAAESLACVREAAEQGPVAARLLPDLFTLSDLQAAHEALLGRPVDKRNFRRDVLGGDHLEEAGEVRRGAHRPAMTYRLSRGG